MSRLADIREQDATGKAADIFAGIKKAMGKVPNAYLTIDTPRGAGRGFVRC